MRGYCKERRNGENGEGRKGRDGPSEEQCNVRGVCEELWTREGGFGGVGDVGVGMRGGGGKERGGGGRSRCEVAVLACQSPIQVEQRRIRTRYAEVPWDGLSKSSYGVDDEEQA